MRTASRRRFRIGFHHQPHQVAPRASPSMIPHSAARRGRSCAADSHSLRSLGAPHAILKGYSRNDGESGRNTGGIRQFRCPLASRFSRRPSAKGGTFHGVLAPRSGAYDNISRSSSAHSIRQCSLKSTGFLPKALVPRRHRWSRSPFRQITLRDLRELRRVHTNSTAPGRRQSNIKMSTVRCSSRRRVAASATVRAGNVWKPA
jgi:hypothetical protein